MHAFWSSFFLPILVFSIFVLLWTPDTACFNDSGWEGAGFPGSCQAGRPWPARGPALQLPGQLPDPPQPLACPPHQPLQVPGDPLQLPLRIPQGPQRLQRTPPEDPPLAPQKLAELRPWGPRKQAAEGQLQMRPSGPQIPGLRCQSLRREDLADRRGFDRKQGGGWAGLQSRRGCRKGGWGLTRLQSPGWLTAPLGTKPNFAELTCMHAWWACTGHINCEQC